jgi:predicted SAM-dependent methyltransferase
MHIMEYVKKDFFDHKIKKLFNMRTKLYLFDLIRILNYVIQPIHLIKKIIGVYRYKKLHVGCGAARLKGWINIDGNPLRKKDLWLDVRNKWPFGYNSIRGIASSHLIEHLFDHELEHFLKEAKQVLTPEGFIHLEVPSLEIAIQKYLQDGDTLEFNRKVHWYGAHHQVFDAGRLKKLLCRYGFKHIKCYIGEKKSEYLANTELEEICTRPDESLIIEAIKSRTN